MVPDAYAFHAISAADLPLVRRWLANPHVMEWWGDPDRQFTLVREDLDHRSMQQYIVSLDQRPFAYLQCYDPAAWPDNGFGELPPGTRGIDQFIGEADMIERGHGSALIRRFIDDVLDKDTPRIVTDPSPDNSRAVRADEKAGFRKDRLVDTPDGRALLMVRNR